MERYTHEKEVFRNKKALSCGNEDLGILGIEHTLLNINLPALLWAEEREDALPFACLGKEYWFDKTQVEEIDKTLQYAWGYGIAATAILLNSPQRFGSHEEEALLEKVIHPDFDREDPNAFISAFPMETEDGRDYYRAFVEFLSCRYMRDDCKCCGNSRRGYHVRSAYFVWYAYWWKYCKYLGGFGTGDFLLFGGLYAGREIAV